MSATSSIIRSIVETASIRKVLDFANGEIDGLARRVFNLSNVAGLRWRDLNSVSSIFMKTTHKEIVEYWSQHQSELDLSVDWSEAETLCWRCAEQTKLHRCHIVPDSLQGEDHPSNLVLLCLKCHRDAPNVNDPTFMWKWLRAHAVPFYGQYWRDRAAKEFELIFSRKPFSLIDQEKLDQKSLNGIIAKKMHAVTHHFGEGGLNPSTLAWILNEVEAEAITQLEQSQK